MNLAKLMELYRSLISPNPSLNHLQWMTTQIPLMTDDTVKQARWVGFIQGCLWFIGLRSIDEMRQDIKDLK